LPDAGAQVTWAIVLSVILILGRLLWLEALQVLMEEFA
jgi:hypothetical protein